MRSRSVSTVMNETPMNGPDQRAQATDHGGEEEVEGLADVETSRIDELDQPGVQRPGDAGESGADREGQQRVAADVDAEAGGPRRVVAQRLEGPAPRTAHDPPDQRRGGEEEDEAEVVVVAAGEQVDAEDGEVGAQDPDAARSLGEPDLVVEHEEHQQVERQGDEGQPRTLTRSAGKPISTLMTMQESPAMAMARRNGRFGNVVLTPATVISRPVSNSTETYAPIPGMPPGRG